MNWMWIWLGIIIITVLIEVVTVGLVAIWMTGGAVAALAAWALGASSAIQMVLFFAVTFVLIFFTRPLAIKYINRRDVRSNYEAIIGCEVRVTERVDNRLETGKAVYNGMEWTARALDREEIFEPDETAQVAEIVGVKLILKKPERTDSTPEDTADAAKNNEQALPS